MTATTLAHVHMQQALERLYATFAHYPLRRKVEGCPCCVTQQQEQRLHQETLRLLGHDALRPFSCNGLTTWGKAEDLKHFLPRICELELQHGDMFYGFWHFAATIRRAGFADWPAPEQQAFGAFCLAWWELRLTLPPEPSTQLPTFEEITQFSDDLRPFLAVLLTPPLSTHLLREFAYCYNCLTGVIKARWTPAELQQMEAWLLDKETLRRVWQALEQEAASEETQPDISYAWLRHEVAALL